MASITGSFNNNNLNYSLYIDYSYTQSVTNNTSTITATLKVKKIRSYGQSYGTVPYSLSIAGTTVKSGSLSYNSSSMAVGTVTTICSGSKTVSHNSDGKLSIDISGVFDMSALNPGKGTVSSTINLPTIARKTNVSTSGTYKFGNTITINHAGASSSFTHNIKYYMGSQSGTIASNKSGTSSTWQIPLSLQNEIPNSTTGTIKIVLETLSGGTSIGSSETSFTCTIADSCVPSISGTTFSDGVTKPSGVTGYYQNYSKVKAVISASSPYGATINQYKVTFDSKTYSSTSNTVITELVSNSGSKNIIVYVTDSRGKTASQTYTSSITVTAYAPPSIDSFTYKRMEIVDGVESASNMGTIGYFSVSRSWSSSSTSKSMKFYYKTKASTTWTAITLSDQNYYDYKFSTTLSTADAYSLKISLTDMLQTVSKEIEMANIFALISMNPKGNGLAFGKECTIENLIEVNMNMQFNKPLQFSSELNCASRIMCNGLVCTNTRPTGNPQVVNGTIDTNYIGNPVTRLVLESSTNPAVYVNGTTYSILHTGNSDYISQGVSEIRFHNNDYLGIDVAENRLYIRPDNASIKQYLLTETNPRPTKLWSGYLSGTNSITLTNGYDYKWIAVYGKPGGASAWTGTVFVRHMYDTTSTTNYLQICTEVNYIKFAMYVNGNNVIIRRNAGSGNIEYVYGGY